LINGTRQIMSDKPRWNVYVRTVTLIAVTQMKFARTCIVLAAIIALGSFSRLVSRQLPAALDR